MTERPLVVVTGATGHLGATLCRTLLKQGFAVRGVHLNHDSPRTLTGLNVELCCGDVTDRKFMREVLAEATYVVHAAAKISITGDKDGSIARTNVQGPRIVAELCLELQVKKLIHIASVHMFDLSSVPESLDEKSPLVPLSGFAYDKSKRKGCEEVLALVPRGLSAAVLCPVGLLGPYDYAPSLMGEFWLSLYRGTLPYLMKGKFFWSDVRDNAAAIIQALTAARPGEVYLLGGHKASIQQLVDLAAEVTGKNLARPVLPYILAYLGLPFIAAYSKLRGKTPLYTYESIKVLHHSPESINFSKAQQQLNYELRPLAETIADTYAWHFAQKNLSGKLPAQNLRPQA